MLRISSWVISEVVILSFLPVSINARKFAEALHQDKGDRGGFRG